MSTDRGHDPPSDLDAVRRDAYLARLGVEAPARPTGRALRALHVAHLRRIPFENLDIHLGVPIHLEVDALVDKLTVRHRGGFCYELNGAFAGLLRSLGYDVVLREARVHTGDTLGIRFDHLCLLVTTEDGPFLADVGFGACFDEPLAFDHHRPQDDPAGTFRIDPSGGGQTVVQDGVPQYWIDPTPRQLHDFAPGRDHHTQSPDSHFTTGTVCSVRTVDGRDTIRGRRLIVTHLGDRRERTLEPDELADAYDRHFDIGLTAAQVRRLAATSPST